MSTDTRPPTPAGLEVLRYLERLNGRAQRDRIDGRPLIRLEEDGYVVVAIEQLEPRNGRPRARLVVDLTDDGRSALAAAEARP